MTEPTYSKHAFISYTKADCPWAEWIAWTLEEAGFTVTIDIWDFRAGQNFLQKMDEALTECEKVIAVLSDDYLKANYTQPEWQSAFASDPSGEKRRLILMRVRECQLPELLKPRLYVDLMDSSEENAKQDILNIWKERGKPDIKPSFPGTTDRVTTSVIEFPTTAKERIPWNISFSRNIFFTGREELIADLRVQLTGSVTAALSQPAALSGLGGIGKTQTAIEYAYRYRDTYKAVFWVRAETEEELISEFVKLADLLNLPEQDQQDQQVVIDAVKRWINKNEDWLLIFDNADKLNLLRPYWPQEIHGHILITTRAQAIGTFGQRVELRQMSTEEGATFLLRRSRIILNNQTLDDASETDHIVRKKLPRL